MDQHSEQSAFPAGVPMLEPDRHAGPEEGACLMELVSLLAGAPWSDRPDCTHPLLSQAARAVNDHTDHDTRQALAQLAPRLAGADRQDASITAALVATLADHALRRGGSDALAERVLRRALRRQAWCRSPRRVTRTWLRATDSSFVAATWGLLLGHVVLAEQSSRQRATLLYDLLATYEGAVAGSGDADSGDAAACQGSDSRTAAAAPSPSA